MGALVFVFILPPEFTGILAEPLCGATHSFQLFRGRLICAIPEYDTPIFRSNPGMSVHLSAKVGWEVSP